MQEPKFVSDIPKKKRLVETDKHSGPAGTVGVITTEPLEFERVEGEKIITVRQQKFYLFPERGAKSGISAGEAGGAASGGEPPKPQEGSLKGPGSQKTEEEPHAQKK